jgi:hypothetical protein
LAAPGYRRRYTDGRSSGAGLDGKPLVKRFSDGEAIYPLTTEWANVCYPVIHPTEPMLTGLRTAGVGATFAVITDEEGADKSVRGRRQNSGEPRA